MKNVLPHPASPDAIPYPQVPPFLKGARGFYKGETQANPSSPSFTKEGNKAIA
jgi:hypothetical protein